MWLKCRSLSVAVASPCCARLSCLSGYISKRGAVEMESASISYTQMKAATLTHASLLLSPLPLRSSYFLPSSQFLRGREYGSLLCSRSGRSHATLLTPTRGGEERCVQRVRTGTLATQATSVSPYFTNGKSD